MKGPDWDWPLSRRLIELHGGTIGVESEMGKGKHVLVSPCRKAR